MNKKKLSVVMAGAMLATSVAPVLAAETTTTTTEFAKSDVKVLSNQIKKLMEENKVSSNKALYADMLENKKVGSSNGRFLSADVAKAMEAGESIYGVETYDADGTVKKALTYDIATAVTNIEELNTKGQSVKVFKRATTTFKGEVIPGSQITVDSDALTQYAKTDLITNSGTTDTAKADFINEATLKDKADTTKNSAIVEKVEMDSNKIDVNIVTRALDEKNEQKVIKVREGNDKLDFQLALDAEGKLLDATNPDDVQKFAKFANLVTYKISTTLNEKELENTYKIVDDKENVETIAASDLYDGFALTAKGTEMQADLKNAADKANETIATASNALVKLENYKSGVTENLSGIYTFDVIYYKKTAPTVKKQVKKVTVKSTNKKEMESLYNLMVSGTFKVGIVAGDNRYETAVNVAKAQNLPKVESKNAQTTKDEKKNNIVLVNGNSLVDGLSAAPLAASLNWNARATGTAVLLSDTDSLPSATKEYLEELTEDISKANKKYVTINLVGGESVLSESLVKELKGMGFNVVRFGGDNREETSIEVAEELTSSNDLFVVGGNGEADAMSIAAVAAQKKAPIVVSSVHGLTNDSLKFIKEKEAANSQTVRIIGGESVVSKDEEEKINNVLDSTNGVYRIAGDNRQATNAAVIKEYFNKDAIDSSTGVVLVKDGVSKKGDLVDALSAANYAAKMNAPIVLATSNLTDAQKDSITRIDGTVAKVAQVGEGANRTILETIAGLFNLSNVK